MPTGLTDANIHLALHKSISRRHWHGIGYVAFDAAKFVFKNLNDFFSLLLIENRIFSNVFAQISNSPNGISSFARPIRPGR